MKTRVAIPCHSKRGNALLIALVFSAVVGIVLASYFGLIQSRNLVRARSFAWNSAIPVLEAGVEEAFTHLKDDTNLTANGWASSGSGATIIYNRTRTNSDSSYYTATISNAASVPIIYSSGYVPTPLKQGSYISRRVRVTTGSTGSSFFSKAILARGTINFAGDMQVNSYNSSNTNYSNANGTYNTNKFTANGWVASMASSGIAIDIAGSKIYGGIQYPGGATYNIGSGTVGDAAYVGNAANSGTIESGYNDNTLNITIPATPLPTNSAGSAALDPGWTYVAPTSFTTNGVTYAYVFTNGNYSIGSDTFHNQNILVTGNAKLYIGKNGRLQMGSGNVIKIQTNASFSIYNDSSTDAVFTGIANDSQLPTKFFYWALPDTVSSKLSLTGGGYFAGGIYAYYQDVVLTGGSSANPRDFFGALVANSVVNSGHFYMSYDQALSSIGGGSSVTFAWLEL